MSLHKCLECGTYTLSETCPKCKCKAVPPAPPKFSLAHAKKYSKYRRALKERIRKQKAQGSQKK
jgi:H/ACA ribonucleoprotein complex subunit 3